MRYIIKRKGKKGGIIYHRKKNILEYLERYKAYIKLVKIEEKHEEIVYIVEEIKSMIPEKNKKELQELIKGLRGGQYQKECWEGTDVIDILIKDNDIELYCDSICPSLKEYKKYDKCKKYGGIIYDGTICQDCQNNFYKKIRE